MPPLRNSFNINSPNHIRPRAKRRHLLRNWGTRETQRLADSRQASSGALRAFMPLRLQFNSRDIVHFYQNFYANMKADCTVGTHYTWSTTK